MHYEISITTNKSPFTVFFDMDGVLTDFYGGIYQFIMQKMIIPPLPIVSDGELVKLVVTEVNRIRSENKGVFIPWDIKHFDPDLIKLILKCAIDYDGFFGGLLPLRDGMQQLVYTKTLCHRHSHINMAILSSAGRYKYDKCVQQKTQWLNCYIKPIVGDISYYFTHSSKNKAEYVSSTLDILLDDRQKSINPWNSAGGNGVLWTDNHYGEPQI